MLRFEEKRKNSQRDDNSQVTFSRVKGYSINIFKLKDGDKLLLYIQTNLTVHLFLISSRRKKVMNQRSFNILDIISFDRIEEELDDVDFDREINAPETECKIKEAVFEESSDSLILSIGIGEKELLVKLNQAITSRTYSVRKQVQRVYPGCLSSSSCLIGPFWKDSPLCCDFLEKKNTQSSDLKTLAFISLHDLQKVKVNGFDESKAISGFRQRIPKIFRLGQSTILILGELWAFIYDLQKGRTICQCRHAMFPRKEETTRIFQTEGLIVVQYPNFFDMIKIEQNNQKVKKINKTKTVWFRDFISGLKYEADHPELRIFNHGEGNYLILANLTFKEGSKARVRIRVCSETFEVLEASTIQNRSGIPHASEKLNIHLVSDFFVFQYKPMIKYQDHQLEGASESLQKDPSRGCLTLASLDFQILDQCLQAEIDRWSPSIGMITENRIISRGAKNTFFLHEVDKAAKKLILLKKVVLGAAKIHDRADWVVSPFSFCLIAEIEGTSGSSGVTIFINFDRNLNLISHLSNQRLSDYLFPFQSITQNTVLFYPKSQSDPKNAYILDFDARELKLAHRYSDGGLKFCDLVEGTVGFSTMKIFGDSIEIVTLDVEATQNN